jgi:hypothetical protein
MAAMTHRPDNLLIDLWLVVGAVVATLGHAVLGFQQPEIAVRLGFGYPLMSLFVLWALAAAIQASCWWAWTAMTERRSR